MITVPKSFNMSAVTSAPFVGVKVKEEGVGDALMVELSPKKKFEIGEEKPQIVSRSPIKFREFASVANMEASASKRPKLVTSGNKVVTSERKMVTTERKVVKRDQEKGPGGDEDGMETSQQQRVVGKAMVDIVGHQIHYQMSRGEFYLEKVAVVSMLDDGKRIGPEIIGGVEFVSLRSLESALKEDGALCDGDAAFKESLLNRGGIQLCRRFYFRGRFYSRRSN